MSVVQIELAEILVLPHAIQKARERWNLTGPDEQIAAKIEESVRHWVERGQVYDRKPRPFRPYGHDGFILPWQRLVGSQDRACIVALDQIGKTVVVTSLSAVEKIQGAGPRGGKPKR